jgi:nucleotide-binding universal stress UspA family protein
MRADDVSPQVVIGVDGSEQAQAALEWAASYAESTGARLLAITAWEIPMTFGYYPIAIDVDFAADVASGLDRSVARMRERHPGVRVEPRVLHDYAPRALVETAKDADLLVVGSHGRGLITGTILGSVSNYCVHHAHCPVVVVRDDEGG